MGRMIRGRSPKALVAALVGSMVFATGATAAAKPGAVVITSATATATTISLKWKAGTGTKPTKFEVTCKATGKTTLTATATIAAVTIKKALPNISYSCSIVAIAGTVRGSASTKVIKTKTSVPSAPRAVIAERGNKTIVVSWTAPTTNGGLAITQYIATTTPSSKTCTASGTGSLTCTISGLQNGTTYTVSVKAKNSLGYGASTTSTSVVPNAIPLQPTMTLTSVDQGMTLNWVAPTNASVSHYIVTAGAESHEVSGALSTYTVSGLDNCVAEEFSITAVNDLGSSPVVSQSAIPGGPSALPGPVNNLSVEANDSYIDVSFTPGIAGLMPISSFSVKATNSSEVHAGTLTNTLGSNPVRYRINGVTNGVDYTVTVQANSNCGTATLTSAGTASATPMWANIPARVINDDLVTSYISVTNSERFAYKFTSESTYSEPGDYLALFIDCHYVEMDGNSVDGYESCPNSMASELATVKLYTYAGEEIEITTTGGGWLKLNGSWAYYFKPNDLLEVGSAYLVVITYGTASAFTYSDPDDSSYYTRYDANRKIDIATLEILD
jgi:hypothetical protein